MEEPHEKHQPEPNNPVPVVISTQCRPLSQKFNLSHISIGDVLREEMERGEECPHADIIRANMLAGTIGPIEITMAILKDRITKLMEGGTRVFILDGFPRSIEQSTHFQALIGPITSLLVPTPMLSGNKLPSSPPPRPIRRPDASNPKPLPHLRNHNLTCGRRLPQTQKS
ncbi:hypothetical protein CTAM01_11240 [Colletotrichum tamarilloi]|uniref:Adenylate kinase n=1 Tax=Colletotrichum tamarilloi TaxID=1209934 RepID=A0ABQ9QYJ1_9PEZI|nr:uncharacterized protein CTAM01_11240 [Colletotrichum tamarilloi]KAK1489091.1 hypothetical protein CTAM01_11240 [Colletotrichum tamarilloi]